jgi:hypothetical protein
MEAYETYDIAHAGMRFRVEYHYDASTREPWKEHDGHGIVSDWTTRGKSPGERVLASDRGRKRYYDAAESLKIAKRDSWGPTIEGMTKAQVAADAVERDFQHLRAWCNDGWHWAGVVVTLLDVDGETTHESVALWGIESSETAYLEYTALELAGEIACRIPADGKLVTSVK